MKKVDFDRYTTNYNSLLHQQTEFFASDEIYFARYKVAIVRQHTKKEPRRVLEFGCGIGRNIHFLREAYPSAEIIGTDVSKKSLEVARKNNPGIKFLHEGFLDEDMQDFDLIFIAGVFHHIPICDRLVVARKIISRLSSTGQVFIFEHNPFNLITRRIVSNCPYDEDAILISPAKLRNILLTAGGDLLYQAYTLFFPPRFQFLLPLERYFKKIPFGGQYWVQACRKG